MGPLLVGAAGLMWGHVAVAGSGPSGGHAALRRLPLVTLGANGGVCTKSGIMVGLGETPQEVETIMDDLLAVGCQILTIGQYLQPTHRHYPVAEYVTPQQFATYKTIGLKKGFSIVESAPLVRSSYHAEKHIR